MDKLNDSNPSISFTDFNINNESFSFVVSSSKRQDTNKIDFNFCNFSLGENVEDTVALIASTLCGQSFKNINYDLPISAKCKNLLASFTRANITCSAVANDFYTPSQISDKIILNFSGGLDSLSVLPLIPKEKIELVSMDFGKNFERELNFFKNFNPLIVKTNLRELKYDRESWTFMGCASLATASFLKAKYNCFGTILEANTYQIQNCPSVLKTFYTAPFSYFGLQNACLTNGLTEVGTAKVVLHYLKEFAGESLKSLSNDGSIKLFRKFTLLDILNEKYSFGAKLQPCSSPIPSVRLKFGKSFAEDFLILFMLKHRSVEYVSNIVTDIPCKALEIVYKLQLKFYEKLNPLYISHIPIEYRYHYLQKLFDAGVTLYDDNDFKELFIVRDFLINHRL